MPPTKRARLRSEPTKYPTAERAPANFLRALPLVLVMPVGGASRCASLEILGKFANAALVIFNVKAPAKQCEGLAIFNVKVVCAGLGKPANNAKVFHTLGPVALGIGDGTAAADEVPDQLKAESRFASIEAGRSSLVVGGVVAGLVRVGCADAVRS